MGCGQSAAGTVEDGNDTGESGQDGDHFQDLSSGSSVSGNYPVSDIGQIPIRYITSTSRPCSRTALFRRLYKTARFRLSNTTLDLNVCI